MVLEFESLLPLTGNLAGIGIIVAAILSTFRNWSGSPELKMLRDEMRRTHGQLESLMGTLAQVISSDTGEEK